MKGRYCCINCSEVAWPWACEVNRGASREIAIDAIQHECVESQEVITFTPKTQRDGTFHCSTTCCGNGCTSQSKRSGRRNSRVGSPSVEPRSIPAELTPGQDPPTPRILHAQHLHLRHIIIARPTVPAETRNGRGSNGKIDKVCKFGTRDAQEERMTTMLYTRVVIG